MSSECARARPRRLTAALTAVALTAVAVVVLMPAAAGAASPRTLLVGDSTLAALAWNPSVQSGLSGLDYVLDAESCRAVTGPSCVGRVDPRTGKRTRPTNVLDVLRSHPAGSFQELVIMAGYDESYAFFQRSVEIIPEVARQRGIAHITWLTFHTDGSYVPPPDYAKDYSYRSNNRLLVDAAQRSNGYITLLDWNTHVHSNPGLVLADGVHLTGKGAVAVGTLIAQAVRQHWGSSAATTIARYGSVGESVKEMQKLLIAGGAQELARYGATGRFFSVTDRAVRALQKTVRERYDQSMVVDGVVGPLTRSWLQRLAGAGAATTAPSAPRPTLSYGALGESVKELQRLLIAEGGFDELARHGATGRFYGVTQRAVRAYQQRIRDRHDKSMVVDGIVGPRTWSWLTRAS